MDREQNISFIPRAPLNANPARSRPINPFFTVAVTVFLLSVAATVGAYAYKTILDRDLGDKQNKIRSLWKDYDQTSHSTVSEADGLNAQLSAVKEILDDHATLTPFFAFLQAHTLKTIQLTKFDFSRDQKDQGGKWVAKVSAAAPGYMDAALQREEFKKCTASFVDSGTDTTDACGAKRDSLILSDFAISVPTLTDQGTVAFDMTFTLNSDPLRYRNAILNGSTSVANTSGTIASTTP